MSFGPFSLFVLTDDNIFPLAWRGRNSGYSEGFFGGIGKKGPPQWREKQKQSNKQTTTTTTTKQRTVGSTPLEREAVDNRGKIGRNWLRNHLWCPNDPRG